jgi:hypothetical protein
MGKSLKRIWNFFGFILQKSEKIHICFDYMHKKLIKNSENFRKNQIMVLKIGLFGKKSNYLRNKREYLG